jgi:hypothetical protein
LHVVILCSTLVKVHPHVWYRGGKKKQKKTFYDEASQKFYQTKKSLH